MLRQQGRSGKALWFHPNPAPAAAADNAVSANPAATAAPNLDDGSAASDSIANGVTADTEPQYAYASSDCNFDPASWRKRNSSARSNGETQRQDNAYTVAGNQIAQSVVRAGLSAGKKLFPAEAASSGNAE